MISSSYRSNIYELVFQGKKLKQSKFEKQIRYSPFLIDSLIFYGLPEYLTIPVNFNLE